MLPDLIQFYPIPASLVLIACGAAFDVVVISVVG